jgi:RimJ/RimL family protein N-acetyltransferase
VDGLGAAAGRGAPGRAGRWIRACLGNLLALSGLEQFDRSVRIVLETERILLRHFTEVDAKPLAALYGDPRVMRFSTPQPPSLEKVASEVLPEYLREYRELADGLGSFAAIEKETGRMAGRFSLKPANSYGLTGGTELGYRLYPAFWGRGLATEGSRCPDADRIPGAEHGDVVYELTRSDWARLVNPAAPEVRRPGHSS